MKSVEENEANRFCLALTLWPPGKIKVNEKRYKMVAVNGAYKHSTYEQIWSHRKVFATWDRQPAHWLSGHLANPMSMTHYIDPYNTHMV